MSKLDLDRLKEMRAVMLDNIGFEAPKYAFEYAWLSSFDAVVARLEAAEKAVESAELLAAELNPLSEWDIMHIGRHRGRFRYDYVAWQKIRDGGK